MCLYTHTQTHTQNNPLLYDGGVAPEYAILHYALENQVVTDQSVDHFLLVCQALGQ